MDKATRNERTESSWDQSYPSSIRNRDRSGQGRMPSFLRTPVDESMSGFSDMQRGDPSVKGNEGNK